MNLGRKTQLTAALTLTLCFFPTARADAVARSFTDMVETIALVPAGAHNSDILAKVTVAVNFIKSFDLPKAHLAVNEALQLDPRNGHLHFLNGFVYHLQARQGDTQKGEMALEGYQQALRIDLSNWIAHEFLGLAYMDLKQFSRAKGAFTEALLLTPDSSVSVYGLMLAAYLTGDAKTACAMADQYRKVSTQPSPEFLRSSIAVYASCGSFTQANGVRTALLHSGASAPEFDRIDRRLAQWQTYYSKQEAAAISLSAMASLNQAQSDVRPDAIAQASKPASSPKAEAVSAEPAAAEQIAPPDTSASGPRMLLVDVVLLSTQEQISTSKGVNLLSALTLQLGAITGNVAAYSRVITSTAASNNEPAISTAITRAVTIPALSYSLNIANANNSFNEVLARPTLAAIEGMPSEFFSGTNLSAGIVSTSTQGGTTIVPFEKRFGIKLGVTPRFLSQGRVQLKVEAQRTALTPSNENPRAAYQVEIAETTANANIVMNMGDTLVLSGLSEKYTLASRQGVPGLQDIPGIQYLFSEKNSTSVQRSVLILVTPRAPEQIAESGEGQAMAARMKILRERFGFGANMPINSEVVMSGLQGSDYFRQFRQGDVAMERWDRMRTTGDRLKEALGFLYY